MRKICCAVLALCILAAPFTASAKRKREPLPMSRTGDMMLFDFGNTPEDGWHTVNDKTRYSRDTGYGFSMISFVENEDLSGSGVLSDALKIRKYYWDKTAFKLDLPEGMYEISVYSGQISYMNVELEGYPVIFNMQHSKTESRIEIPVTDGTLDMSLAQGSSGVDLSVSAMTVKRTGDISDQRRRVFICGDSTAATMYPMFISQPLDEGYAGGWGQLLGAYMPESVYVHNISSSGASTELFADRDTLKDRLHFACEGDYVVIALGINDKNSISADEYKENLKVIAKATEEMGCIPIIASDTAQLKEYENGEYIDLCYAKEAKEAAEELGVRFLDLHESHAAYLKALGYDTAQTLFWRQWSGDRDMTHPNRNGAGQIARIAAELMSGIDDLGGGVTSYGISGDSRIKCEDTDTSLRLENTTPNDMTLAVIYAGYNGGILCRADHETVTIPAYDVLSPNTATETDIPRPNSRSAIYIVGDGIEMKIK